MTRMNSHTKIVLTCLANFVPVFVAIFPVFGSLVCWLLWKDDADAAVADYVRQRLNTGISWTIYFSVAGLLTFVLVGWLILPILGICWLIFAVLDALRALNGDTSYRFPGTIEFVNPR